MVTEDWEQCFLPLDHPDCIKPPSLVPEHLPPVQCLHCQKEVPQPFYVVKHFGRAGTRHLPFCDELCHQLEYLKRIRKEGL